MVKQMPVIRFLLAEKCKQYEIYRKMSDVYGKASFSKKNVYKWTKYGCETTSPSQKDNSWSRNALTLG